MKKLFVFNGAKWQKFFATSTHGKICSYMRFAVLDKSGNEWATISPISQSEPQIFPTNLVIWYHEFLTVKLLSCANANILIL